MVQASSVTGMVALFGPRFVDGSTHCVFSNAGLTRLGKTDKAWIELYSTHNLSLLSTYCEDLSVFQVPATLVTAVRALARGAEQRAMTITSSDSGSAEQGRTSDTSDSDTATITTTAVASESGNGTDAISHLITPAVTASAATAIPAEATTAIATTGVVSQPTVATGDVERAVDIDNVVINTDKVHTRSNPHGLVALLEAQKN